ncbi:MAG: NCS2 family permease, partial [Candidatus Zixiibacteriota bacterium]
STVTSYIESAAGVEAGGRTGLTAVFTGLLFLLAVFFAPLIRMVGGGVPVAEGSSLVLYPITAPALIVVGCLMIQSAARVVWNDLTEAVPAFLIMIGMALTYSIADGLAFGFITYPLLKLFSGRGREVSWLVYVLGAIFVLRYAALG